MNPAEPSQYWAKDENDERRGPISQHGISSSLFKGTPHEIRELFLARGQITDADVEFSCRPENDGISFYDWRLAQQEQGNRDQRDMVTTAMAMQWKYNLQNWPSNPWMKGGMTYQRLNEIYWIASQKTDSPESIQVRAARLEGSDAKRRKTSQAGGAGCVAKMDLPQYKALVDSDKDPEKRCAKGCHVIKFTNNWAIWRMFESDHDPVCQHLDGSPPFPSEIVKAQSHFQCSGVLHNFKKQRWARENEITIDNPWHAGERDYYWWRWEISTQPDTHDCGYEMPWDEKEWWGFCDRCETPQFYCRWCVRRLVSIHS